MLIYNKIYHKNRRKALRLNPTNAEKILWSHLRNSCLGLKFRRQHGIGEYIVDLYCPAKRLVIEVDGDSHFDEAQIKYDKLRTEYFNKLKINILRFTNLEIYHDLERVLEAIEDYAKNTPSNSPLVRGRDRGSVSPPY
ncbi:MAG: hypothetical protein UU36_C0049G0004 [Candidatus Uhrbacteria bacterium GW2011_GWE2_41_1153]|nr:MAG: hypothetical protein UU36_C0049G0004 [Candidatus Uhrbacteria bacterium GW2011_GWE2_41_1153]